MSQEPGDLGKSPNEDGKSPIGDSKPAGGRPAWMTPASVASAVLFAVAAALTFLVSRFFFILFIPAVILSLLGLREHSKSRGRLRRTGLVMVFNGIVLMVSLFLVGFLRDFVVAHPAVHDESVALAYTTGHIMLGVGLFLTDFRMTHEGAVPNQ